MPTPTAHALLSRLSVRLLQQSHPLFADRYGSSLDWKLSAIEARQQVCQLRAAVVMAEQYGPLTTTEARLITERTA